MKKIIFILIAVIIINSVVNVMAAETVNSSKTITSVFLEYEEFGDNLTWTLTEKGELIIKGIGNMPDTSDASDVPWYKRNVDIKSVIIENGVTDICPWAFFGCSNLTEVKIPESVAKIGFGAFTQCSSLKEITLPDHIADIGDNAFSFCAGLESISIPDSVQKIGERAFESCTAIKAITLSPDINHMGAYALKNCTSLRNIVIPKGIENISVGLFEDCENLETVIFPDGVKKIDSAAFSGCTRLTGIQFPDSLESICDNAFYGCESLTEIYIPDNILYIGFYAFGECSGIEKINVSEKNTTYSSQYDVLFDKEKKKLILCAAKKQGDYAVPESVTTIYDKAFWKCTNLISVTLSPNMSSILGEIFYGCTNLESINIPGSIVEISAEAISLCDNMTDIYYEGLQAEWDRIKIYDKSFLINVTVHCSDSAILLMPVMSVTSENGEVKVSVNDKEIIFPDAKPFIDENGRTQIPVRAAAEALGCKVDYDGETRLVTVTDKENVITLTIGSRTLTKNGTVSQMDTEAIISVDRTYIPARFIAEALGFEVKWNQP